MRVLWVLLSLAAGVGAGVGAFVALERAAPPALPEPASSGAAPPEAPLGAAASAAPESTPAAVGSASPEASAAASASSAPVEAASAVVSASAAPAAPPSPEEASSCLPTLFSKDAFLTKRPNLGFVCSTSAAKDIASRLRVALVDSGGGHVSDSMKEWSQLGFYELAVVAALRGRCCEGAPALELPEAPEGCDPLGPKLAAIASASRRGAPETEIDGAVEAFDGAIRCALKLRRAAVYGYSKVLPGEASVFRKTYARTRGD